MRDTNPHQQTGPHRCRRQAKTHAQDLGFSSSTGNDFPCNKYSRESEDAEDLLDDSSCTDRHASFCILRSKRVSAPREQSMLQRHALTPPTGKWKLQATPWVQVSRGKRSIAIYLPLRFELIFLYKQFCSVKALKKKSMTTFLWFAVFTTYIKYFYLKCFCCALMNTVRNIQKQSSS